jgi:threonine dehydrogenase-like Zn-dependent dehydrogenase
MRALIYANNTLRLDQHFPQPVPTPGEALIRVTMAGICNTDIEITRGYLAFQGVPGHEFAGVVEEIYGALAQQSHKHLIGKRVVG